MNSFKFLLRGLQKRGIMSPNAVSKTSQGLVSTKGQLILQLGLFSTVPPFNSNDNISPSSQVRYSNTSAKKTEHVVILGGGIAGLSSARYLLALTEKEKNLTISLIDKNVGSIDANKKSELNQSNSTENYESRAATLFESYVQQQIDFPHFNIPSRRNGNVLCPSLTVPWTSRSLWSDAFLPMLKNFVTKSGTPNSSIHFDWAHLVKDKYFWNFATHFLIQKFLLGRTEHQSKKSILEHTLQCFEDPTDELIQSIDCGRWAEGTKQLNGSIATMDSSGDVSLFCRGLLKNLLSRHGDRFKLVPGEEVTDFEVDEKILFGVTSRNQNVSDKNSFDSPLRILTYGL
mmetsp:Transcript_5190/g.10369  ORF Transcript_5190/g.10369 Transcript_5190/m.10369 type:complete len:344 (-) Transcript_5190:742-1773(-)